MQLFNFTFYYYAFSNQAGLRPKLKKEEAKVWCGIRRKDWAVLSPGGPLIVPVPLLYPVTVSHDGILTFGLLQVCLSEWYDVISSYFGFHHLCKTLHCSAIKFFFVGLTWLLLITLKHITSCASGKDPPAAECLK